MKQKYTFKAHFNQYSCLNVCFIMNYGAFNAIFHLFMIWALSVLYIGLQGLQMNGMMKKHSTSVSFNCILVDCLFCTDRWQHCGGRRLLQI